MSASYCPGYCKHGEPHSGLCDAPQPVTPENPAAFPFNEKDGGGSHYYSHPGMTLRDWFAGQALSGGMVGSFSSGYLSDTTAEVLARESYLVADAMLAARGAS